MLPVSSGIGDFALIGWALWVSPNETNLGEPSQFGER
jgi:hypothetical protein